MEKSLLKHSFYLPFVCFSVRGEMEQNTGAGEEERGDGIGKT